MILLNALRTIQRATLANLLDAGDVSVELSMLEGVGGLESLLARISAGQIVFGSHAPLFYLEAAALKLVESELTSSQAQAIRFLNARRLLPDGKTPA